MFSLNPPKFLPTFFFFFLDINVALYTAVFKTLLVCRTTNLSCFLPGQIIFGIVYLINNTFFFYNEKIMLNFSLKK